MEEGQITRSQSHEENRDKPPTSTLIEETDARGSRGWNRRSLGSFLAALLIAISVTVWCRIEVGPTLGLFLGSLFLASLIAPPLALAAGFGREWIAASAVILGITIVWATSLSAADVNFWEWLRCCLVLAAFVLALAGFSAFLSVAGMNVVPAAAIATILGSLWLSWPVWLSPWLTQGLSDWLVPANPLFAINAVLEHLGTWERAPLAYQRLTVLNQDVAYRLPASIAPALIVHALIGAGGLLAAARAGKRISIQPVSAPV